jgi:hypothetical protein
MRVNVAPDFSPVIAALCRMYGKRVEGGWYEIYIPAHIIGDLSPTGELQRSPDIPTEPGWRFRYRYNRVVDGTVINVEQVEPDTQSPMESPPTQHIDEWA